MCDEPAADLVPLAARDDGVPFDVAPPSPPIDLALQKGAGIPIEERDAREATRLPSRARRAGAARRGSASV